MKAFTVTFPDGKVENLTFEEILARSERTILYFYPKDNTPGCTLEGQDFSRLAEEFAAKGIQIIGVSLDNAASHAKFQSSCRISIPLVSDDGTLCKQFGVMGNKNWYGKLVYGLMRSSFLLNKEGNILEEWRSVKATWHADRLLRELA